VTRVYIIREVLF